MILRYILLPSYKIAHTKTRENDKETCEMWKYRSGHVHMSFSYEGVFFFNQCHEIKYIFVFLFLNKPLTQTIHLYLYWSYLQH